MLLVPTQETTLQLALLIVMLAGKAITALKMQQLTMNSQQLAQRVLTQALLARLKNQIAQIVQKVCYAPTWLKEHLKLVLPASQVWLAHLQQLLLELTHVQLVPILMLSHILMTFQIVLLAQMVTNALKAQMFFITQ